MGKHPPDHRHTESRIRAHGCVARLLIQFRKLTNPPIKRVEISARRREFPFESRYALIVGRDRGEMRVVYVSLEPRFERRVAAPPRLEIHVGIAHGGKSRALALPHEERIDSGCVKSAQFAARAAE